MGGGSPILAISAASFLIFFPSALDQRSRQSGLLNRQLSYP